MKKQTMGRMIAALRKEKGLTQLELAEQMGVTDKAVSKWERNLSCPDISSVPKLAELLGISVNELMQVKAEKDQSGSAQKIRQIVRLILKVVPLAMGVGVVALSAMKELDVYAGFSMLGIGLACLGILQIQDERSSQ